MEEKTGLIKGITCQYRKIDPEQVAFLCQRAGLNAADVKEMLRYNIMTVNQFAQLAKLSVSHTLNKTRASVIEGGIGTELDYCYPFADAEGDGPKFIVRNEKSEKYLKA